MKRGLSVAAAMLLHACIAPAFAAEESKTDVGFVAEAGFEFGGDDVATVSFTDGSSQDVEAGQGVTLALGFHVRPAGGDFDIAATVGYKFVTTAAENADIGIDRVVLQGLVIYDPADSWWVGAGPAWHTGVKFDGDGFGPDLDLGDSLGFTLQAGWRWLAITYTNMEYQEETTRFGLKYDASAIGLTLRWRG